jgi:hypothetical protein
MNTFWKCLEMMHEILLS